MNGPSFTRFGMSPWRVRDWLGSGSFVVICRNGDSPARGWGQRGWQ